MRPEQLCCCASRARRDKQCTPELSVSLLVQVSGAIMKMGEGTGKGGPRMLELRGAPEQVQAAQNMVQAFLLVGHQQPDFHDRA